MFGYLPLIIVLCVIAVVCAGYICSYEFVVWLLLVDWCLVGCWIWCLIAL